MLPLFATFCYSQHSHLHFNNTYLSSQSGVQQGDPLGPLLFSLALWPIIKEIETKLPNLVQHNWYLDDGILAGTHQQLCTALNLLTHLGEGCGLELRIEKCELWSPVDLNAIDNRVKRNSKEGLEILGAAIGNPSFVAASLRKRFNKIGKLLDNLAYLEDPHCALGILRSCLGAQKMVYSLRCNTPSDESSVILQDFDKLQRTTFENMLGTLISDNAWKQACLPISKTGVGIRQAIDQLKAAFVGSVSQADALVEQITGEKITDNQIFKETVEELKNLEISQYTQHKIQEALERWKSGDYAALWYEAASMKQSNKTSNESIDALASRAKSLCLQGQFGRAAKVLSSDGVAPDNAAMLNELKKLHPKEKQPDHQFDQDANTNAYQFDEASVFFQIESFSKFTAAGPSKIYPEHLLHAVNCSAPDQSKRAITNKICQLS